MPSRRTEADAAAPLPKPLKRPRQARARFTVQAVYDAFVRIWQRDGWTRLTTRAVALETGISVGTLYEYFPNKEALLSGYLRHAMEALLARFAEADDAPTWQEELARLVRLTAGADPDAMPYVDREMLLLEARVAEPRHHKRFYEELVAAWRARLQRCRDLPRPIDDAALRALVVAAWGGRRYLLLVAPDDLDIVTWARQMEALSIAALHSHRSG